MGKDYYKILGVPKDADTKTIKRAYRKLAVKWHPDKNLDNKEQAKEKFTEIGEAYEVLSDPEKRKIFDQFGEDGLKHGGPQASSAHFGDGAQFHFGFGDAQNIFEQFFGSNGMSGMFTSFGDTPMSNHPNMFGGPDMFNTFSSNRNRAPKQDPPIEHKLRLSLEDLYTGTVKHLKIKRIELGPNNTTRRAEKVVEIKVKPGWKPGTKVKFREHGDQHVGRKAADIVFVVAEKDHPHFKRIGNNLHYKKKVTLTEALVGLKFKVPTLDAKRPELIVDCTNDIITPNFTKRIRGAGMVVQNKPGIYGDLIIEFDIRFPNRPLSPGQKQKIREANL